MLLLILLVFVLAALFYVYYVYPLGIWKRKGVSYVQALPFVGNFGRSSLLIEAVPDLVLKVYNSCSKDERYVGMHQFSIPILLIRDPELIKLIAIKETDKFRDHMAFTSEDIDPLWSRNLFSAKGDDWHALRSTLSPTFTGSKMRAMFSLMEECSREFVSYFEDKRESTIEVELRDTLSRFANDVIGTCAFGVQCNSLRDPKNDFFVNGREATDFSGIRNFKIYGFLFCPALMRLLNVKLFSDTVANFFRSLIRESIEYRKKEGIIRPDVIHLLLEARKNDKHGILSTDDDITAQALIFFFAGFDTISTGMMFLHYELAINPDIQDKLYKEIEETLKQCNGALTYDALMSMKYLDMVVSESLRKWPGTITDRMCNTTFEIEPKLPHEKKFTIDQNILVWFPIMAMMRDERFYPEPEKFIPERFSEENKKNIDPATYLSFGVGPRNCIGSRFALMEMKVLTVNLLHKFEIVPTKKTLIPMILSPKHFNPYPKSGMHLAFKKRTVLK